MSVEENKAVIRRFIEEGINGQNLALLDECFDRDLVWHGGAFGEVRGLDQFKEAVGSFFIAFPDLTTTIEAMLAEGDTVAVRFSVRGTHQGEFMGVPATGKEVRWAGHPLYRFDGGKIVEEWFFEDHISVLQQIGGIPEPAPA